MKIEFLDGDEFNDVQTVYTKGHVTDMEEFLRAVHAALVLDNWSTREAEDYEAWKTQRVGNMKPPVERVKRCWMRWEIGQGGAYDMFGMIYDEKPAGNKGKGMFPVTTLELI